MPPESESWSGMENQQNSFDVQIPVRRKGRRIWLFAAITLLAAAIVAGALAAARSDQSRDYELAEKLLESGSYAQAMEHFERLGDYEDSEEKLQQCKEGLLREAYDAAVTLMNVGSYEEAIEAFSALDDYLDSADRLARCRREMDRAQQTEQPQQSQQTQQPDKPEENGRTDRQEASLKQTAEIGQYVVFGSYEQDNDRTNGKEPLEWLVLDKDGDKIFVISRYALDCRQFHDEKEAVVWKDCTLRGWLNEEFLNTAFTKTEIDRIPVVTVSNDDNPQYGTEAGASTQDRIYLLSTREAFDYFTSDAERQCPRTDYALSRGVTRYDNGCSWWWLRTPGITPNTACGVFPEGGITVSGDYVSCGTDAVRPVMWIDMGAG